MKHHEESSEKFVTSVTVSETLVSAGIQLVHWAHDLAFTDAAYGQEWAYEAANRMATLSELLNILYKRLPAKSLGIVIELPPGVVGAVAQNPSYRPEAEEPLSDDGGSTGDSIGGASSIDDLPF